MNPAGTKSRPRQSFDICVYIAMIVANIFVTFAMTLILKIFDKCNKVHNFYCEILRNLWLKQGAGKRSEKRAASGIAAGSPFFRIPSPRVSRSAAKPFQHAAGCQTDPAPVPLSARSRFIGGSPQSILRLVAQKPGNAFVNIVILPGKSQAG